MPLWFDWILKDGPPLPETPATTLALDAADGVLQFVVRPQGNWPVARCEIFYSVDPDPRSRFWRAADVSRAGESFTAPLPLESTRRPLFAFANVFQTLPEPVSMKALPGQVDLVRESCISSELRSAMPAELTAAGVREQPVGGRLLDDFRHGWRDWFSLNADNQVHWQHRTRKVTDPAWRGPAGSRLAVTLTLPQTNRITVVLIENEWRHERGPRRTFTCTREVLGQPEPQTLWFELADFTPTDESAGSLESWSELDQLCLCGFFPDERPARKPSWDGPQPEFLRIEWQD
jgi:hypothetical protein